MSMKERAAEGTKLDRNVDRRSLLRGIAVGGPAIVTLYGGRAWAVSSCGQDLRQAGLTEQSTVSDANIVLEGTGKSPIAVQGVEADPNMTLDGLNHSCIVSFTG